GEIDGDHMTRTEQQGSGDGRQTDRSGAHDGDDIARGDTSVEDADLVSGRQDVGEHQKLRIADSRRHWVRRGVGEGHADLLCLGPVDVVPKDPAAAAEALAESSLAAETTPPAGRDARYEHPVAGLEVPHGRADPFDRPDRLVAEDPTRRALRNIAFEDVQVVTA